MEVYSVTNARANMFKLIRKVNDQHSPIQITARDGDVVLIAEEDWKAIEETLYLNSVPGLVESILEASKEPHDQMTSAEEIDW